MTFFFQCLSEASWAFCHFLFFALSQGLSYPIQCLFVSNSRSCFEEVLSLALKVASDHLVMPLECLFLYAFAKFIQNSTIISL